MPKATDKLPNTLFVYICDWVDGEPVFAAATDIKELPDDHNGKHVGVYELKQTKKLSIKRELN
jgi:hypothetical protein